MNDATLSVIIHAHNAAATLEELAQSCLGLLPRFFADVEIIIVDDGSDDDTPRLADRLAATHDPVVVLHQQAPGGYGAALLHGLGAARGDYIAALAAGAPRGADDLARMMPALDRAAVVAGAHEPAPGAADRLVPDWPHGAEHAPLAARADVLRALPLANPGRHIHPEIVYRARRAGYDVATIALPDPPARRASLGASIGGLRLRAQLGRERRGAARLPWQQKALLGGALAALLGGAWVALRRR